jgi:hypothetical protein
MHVLSVLNAAPNRVLRSFAKRSDTSGPRSQVVPGSIPTACRGVQLSPQYLRSSFVSVRGPRGCPRVATGGLLSGTVHATPSE